MNVIVSNEQKNKLESLDCDIIKNISGTFSSSELVNMFKDFFYNKIIIDITALRNYNNIKTYEELVKEFDTSKLIIFLQEGTKQCTPNFLSQLISLGIYNFTPNINGIDYLIKKSNTLDDVQQIVKLAEKENKYNSSDTNSNISTKMTIKQEDPTTIIGFKNVTEHAGSTSLIYMLKKELNTIYGKDNVACIEVGKEDFTYFNEQNMYSVFEDNLLNEINKNSNKKIILIDLNKCKDDSMCKDIYYLIEPSTLKLNKMLSRNRIIFNQLKDKKIILNKSTLNSKDVVEFEKESLIKIFYNIPSLDERKRNQIINEFLVRIGLLGDGYYKLDSKVFGLFRR